MVRTALVCALTGCSGGGGGTANVAVPPLASAPPVVAPAAANVRFALTIPGASATATATGRRVPAFVSSKTQGAEVAVFASDSAQNARPVATFAVDLSAATGACGAASTTTGARACTFDLPLAAGRYDISVDLEDAPPSGGAFTNAKVLGRGQAQDTTIALHAANVVAIDVFGAIARIAVAPVRTVVPLDAPATFAPTVTGYDADGVPIVATSATDYYLNSIDLAVADQGAHTTVAVDGGSPGNDASLFLSTDVATVAYDGKAAAGYSATLTASAFTVSGVSTTLDTFAVSTNLVSFLGTQSQDVTITEPHATGPAVVAPAANCAQIVTVGALTGSPGAQSLGLASGSKAGTCYVTVTAETGTASVAIKVVNQVPAIVTIPQRRLFAGYGGSTPTILAYDLANGGNVVQTIAGAATTLQDVDSIARDANGDLVVADLASGTVDRFSGTASGAAAPFARLVVPGVSGSQGLPFAAGVDRAGDIVALQLFGELDEFAGGSQASLTSSQPSLVAICQSRFAQALALDAAGSSAAGAQCFSGSTATSFVTFAPLGTATASRILALPANVAPGAGSLAFDLAGDLVVADAHDGEVLVYGPSASSGTVGLGFGAPPPPLRTVTGTPGAGALAVANDGTIYVVTHTGSGTSAATSVSVVPPGATSPSSSFPIGSGNVAPVLAL